MKQKFKKDILVQDFNEILENKNIKWKNFKNKTKASKNLKEC